MDNSARKAALEDLYTDNPHILEGIRTTSDPNIIHREFSQKLPKIIKKKLSEESVISQDPNYYLEESTIDEAILRSKIKNKDDYYYEVGASLCNFYDDKKQEIYKIIQENNPSKLLESDQEDPSAFLIDIFSEDSNYNKDLI